MSGWVNTEHFNPDRRDWANHIRTNSVTPAIAINSKTLPCVMHFISNDFFLAGRDLDTKLNGLTVGLNKII